MSFDLLHKAVVPMDYPREIRDTSANFSLSGSAGGAKTYELPDRDRYTMYSPGYTRALIVGEMSLTGSYNSNTFKRPEFYFNPFPSHQYAVGDFPTSWYLITLSYTFRVATNGYPGGYWNIYLSYDHNNGMYMNKVDQYIGCVTEIANNKSGSFQLDIWVDTTRLPRTQVGISATNPPIFIVGSTMDFQNCSFTWNIPRGEI